MNPFDNPADEDIRFDRLVDGEMSETERRNILAALDDEPGGWRRCALAFLEAQAWRESMKPVRGGLNPLAVDAPCDVSATPQPKLPPAAQQTGQPAVAGRSSLVPLALAMAACFLVAFFLGTEFRRRASPDPIPPTPLAQQETPERGEPAADQTPPAAGAADTPSQVIPWGEATFVVDGEGGQEVDVPVFDLDPYARHVLLESSNVAFDDLRQHLQRRGFDVQRDVRWSPIEMGGGQQMLVPVGDFVISPVSQRAIP